MNGAYFRIEIMDEFRGPVKKIVQLRSILSIQKSGSFKGISKTNLVGNTVTSDIRAEPVSMTTTMGIGNIWMSDTIQNTESVPVINPAKADQDNYTVYNNMINELSGKFLRITTNVPALGVIENAQLLSYDTPVKNLSETHVVTLVWTEFFVAEVERVQGSLIRVSRSGSSGSRTASKNSSKNPDDNSIPDRPDAPDHDSLLVDGIQSMKDGSVKNLIKGAKKIFDEAF